MNNYTRIMFASAAVLPVVGFAGLGIASAATNTGDDTFAQKFATRFNLKTDDVKSFMNETRTAREAEMKTKSEDALKTAGLSDIQISALQTKHDEQRTANKVWQTANPDATATERIAQRENEKISFEAWAKVQGIDLKKVQEAIKSAGLMGGMGMGGRGHSAMRNGL